MQYGYFAVIPDLESVCTDEARAVVVQDLFNEDVALTSILHVITSFCQAASSICHEPWPL